MTSKVLSIEGLNSHQTGQLFVGDIMVVYTTYLEKENKSRYIMCADMTDEDAMMTVTLTVPPQLVEKHAEKTVTRQWYLFSYLVLFFTFPSACMSDKLHKYCIVPCCNYNCSVGIQICFCQWNNNCIEGRFHLCCSKI